jgi:hypothetical protein
MRPWRTRRRTLVAAAVGATVILAAVSAGLARSGSPSQTGGDPEKAALQSFKDQVRAEAAAQAPSHAKPADPAAARPAPDPDGLPATGIIPVSVPFNESEYVIGNDGWQDVIGNERITVYPGSMAGDADQGVVVVAVTTLPPARRAPNFNDETSGEQADVKAYPTPGRDGAVQPTSVSGNLLTLTAEDGTRFVFNIPGRRFVGS